MAKVITISEYLGGISPLITEEALGYVLAKRRMTGEEVLPQFAGQKYTDENWNEHEYTAVSERDMELAEGTAYYWLSNLPVGGSTEKVADGNFSRSEGGWTVSKANIEEWMRKYRLLFQKWEEELLDRSKIRILNW